ncbi:MAG TPA: hypothetical protein PK765_07465 [bacterium]|nr:hypothetical protein [bacterium]
MPYVSHYGGPGLQIWKFNGTSWNLVGGTIASVDGALDYPSMIVADDGTVYAAYYDKTQESTSRYGRVVKYDGSSWVQVGSNISPSPTGGVSGTAFAKGVNGTIYLHLFNWATSRAEVYVVGDSSLTMLDETLPNNNASGGPGQLLVNPVNGRLYSIGEWTGNGLRMTGLFSYSSMPSSGSSIGTAINGAGTGMLSTRGLAFDSTGTGYVSFIDYAAGRNTDVMKRGSNGVWTVL